MKTLENIDMTTQFHTFKRETTMNTKNAATAEKMLSGRTERTQLMSFDRRTNAGRVSGYCLSVEWIGGGSRIFYSLEDVEQWLENHPVILCPNLSVLRQMHDEIVAVIKQGDSGIADHNVEYLDALSDLAVALRKVAQHL